MTEYGCNSCGYIYDPERSDCNNILFGNTPDGWKCPACGADKNKFERMGSDYKAMKKEFEKNTLKIV